MLLLLLACAPCTLFSEMTYDGPPDLADIVADFAAWSGRDGVCVPGVEVVAEIDGEAHMAGQFAGAGAPIRLAEAADYRVALFHELCHALDAMEGLTDADPDPGDAVDTAVYDTPALRRKEAFALVCQDGPAAVSFEAALAERCGLDVDPARARVRAVAYPAAPPEPDVSVGPDPTRAPVDLSDAGTIVAAAGRADGAWLRLAAGRAREVAWWPAPGASAPPDDDVPISPSAWASPADAPVGPAGDALWTWYAHGIAGAGVGSAEAWALTTDCTTGMGAGAPAWVGARPAVFTGQVERWIFTW